MLWAESFPTLYSRYCCLQRLEGQFLASVGLDVSLDSACGLERVAVGGGVEIAVGGLVGSSAKVISAGNSVATVSGVEGLLAAAEDVVLDEELSAYHFISML